MKRYWLKGFIVLLCTVLLMPSYLMLAEASGALPNNAEAIVANRALGIHWYGSCHRGRCYGLRDLS